MDNNTTTPPKAGRKVSSTPPYFLIRKRKGCFETRGQPTAKFGCPLGFTSNTLADGIFARWCWDGTRLIANNDRYGFYPLFWCELPNGGVCISSSLVTLVEHGASTELNFEALSVFFRLGTFVGDDTPFTAVKTVPPNAVFEWQNGELKCYGRYPKTPGASEISRDDAIDQYIGLFASAMAKRTPTPGKFAVPVSGGRDSRHILLELHRMGIEPDVCISARDNPPDPNQDPEIGRLLCNKLGFRHTVIDQQLSVMSAEIRKNQETHFCAAAHGWYLALADFLSNQFDYIYDGLGGDVLSQSSFLTPALDAAFHVDNTDTISSQLLFGPSPQKTVALKGLLKRQLQKSMAPPIAKRRLSREIEKHLDMPNPVASFFFWNRTRRMTSLAAYGLLNGKLQTHAPFLDHDLFDFMSTLPSEMLLDRTFHDDAIARAYPAFAQIPYANHKAAPPADDTLIKARFLDEAANRFLVRKPWSLMNNTIPRAKLLAGVLSRGRIRPWIPPWIVYLDQLEALIEQRPGQK